jgi:hypothetical protein
MFARRQGPRTGPAPATRPIAAAAPSADPRVMALLAELSRTLGAPVVILAVGPWSVADAEPRRAQP